MGNDVSVGIDEFTAFLKVFYAFSDVVYLRISRLYIISLYADALYSVIILCGFYGLDYLVVSQFFIVFKAENGDFGLGIIIDDFMLKTDGKHRVFFDFSIFVRAGSTRHNDKNKEPEKDKNDNEISDDIRQYCF